MTRRERLTLIQQKVLLAKLEAEEAAGEPDLPWPPVMPTTHVRLVSEDFV